MNKKGSIIQVFVFLILVLLASGITLVLVQTDVISVKSGSGENVLNADFLPFYRQGELILKEIELCPYVNDDLTCDFSEEFYEPGSEIFIRFSVDTTPHNGYIMLVRNYRLLDPERKVILELDAKNNVDFEQQSVGEVETVTFVDKLATGFDYDEGEYTLDVIIENRLLDKKITAKETFTLEYMVEEDGDYE